MEQHYKPINASRLGDCCEAHSDHYFAALTALARARHDLGDVSDNLKRRSAEISTSLRRQHDADKVKYTEGSIAAGVEAHEAVMPLRAELRKKELEVANLVAQVSALEARGIQLSNLVRLNTSNGGMVEKNGCTC